MRIAVVTTRDRRVSETFISDYIVVLRKLGHEIIFFPLRGAGADEWLRGSARPEEGGREWISEPCWELLVASFGESARRLTEIFIPLCDAIRRARPDVIHAHYLTPAGALCVEAKLRGLLGDIPVVVSLHGVDIFKNGCSVPKSAAWCCRNADALIHNSPAMAACLDAWEVDVQSTHYIRRGILLTKFPKPLKVRKEPRRLLAVARLVAKKGLGTLLAAFAEVRAAWPGPLTLRIVGEGPEGVRLKAQAAAAELADSVEFLGELPNHEVLGEMRRADVFCLLCCGAEDGDMDGAPNVVQEAQYLRVPVVSTWISGLPGIVEPGRTALLVPPGDPTAAANAILLLLANRDLRTKLGMEGRRFVRRELSMCKNVKHRVIPLLSRIIEQCATVRPK